MSIDLPSNPNRIKPRQNSNFPISTSISQDLGPLVQFRTDVFGDQDHDQAHHQPENHGSSHHNPTAGFNREKYRAMQYTIEEEKSPSLISDSNLHSSEPPSMVKPGYNLNPSLNSNRKPSEVPMSSLHQTQNLGTLRARQGPSDFQTQVHIVDDQQLGLGSSRIENLKGKQVAIQEEKVQNTISIPTSQSSNLKPMTIHLSDSVKFWTWFSPYRQILVLTIGIQLIAIMITLSGVWIYPRTHNSAMVCGNLLVAIAIRSEWVMRFLYWASIQLIRGWAPMRLRVLVVAFLYHIGMFFDTHLFS